MSLNTGVILLGAAAAGTAAALIESGLERRTLTVKEYVIRSPKLVRGEYKLMFLSDLHDDCFGEDNRKLIRAIEEWSPDAVLIGGDMMTVKKTADIGLTLQLVKKLAERWPICYADGNHESRMDRDRGRYGDLYDRLHLELCGAGVYHLKNGSAKLREDIRVTGVTITGEYYRKFRCPPMPVSFLNERAGEADPDAFQILLAHSPLYRETYADWGADLSLTGHFHGGTIQLPGHIGLMTPQFQFFRRDVTGRFDTRGKTMLVSPGLGTHSINLRINDRPQIVAVRLLPADAAGTEE